MVLNGIEGETREYNGTDYTYHGPAGLRCHRERRRHPLPMTSSCARTWKFSDGEPVTIDDVIFSMYVSSILRMMVL